MARVSRPIESWAAKTFEQGDGIHSDIYITACYLLEEGQDQDTVYQFIRAGCNTVTERHIPDREIWSAIRYAVMKVSGQLVGYKWAKADKLLQAEIKKNYPPNMELLKQQSKSLPQHPSYYLPLLYQPDDLVCIASDAYNWQTLPLPEVIKIVNSFWMEYINPSAMSALTGTTEEGKISSHSRNNTGERTWLVIEFDGSTLEEQHSYHQYLAQTANQKMLIYSGGKSMHGWYDFRSYGESQATSFFELASLLGCDPRTWSKSQFVRIPAGRNNKSGRLQKVLQFQH